MLCTDKCPKSRNACDCSQFALHILHTVQRFTCTSRMRAYIAPICSVPEAAETFTYCPHRKVKRCNRR